MSVNLVVGFAPDPPSRRALRAATDLAARLSADLVIVHAVDLDDYPVDPDAADWDEYAAARLADERAEVGAALAAHPGEWTYETHRGDPVAVLVAAAAEHDAYLIVVGTRGHGAGVELGRLLGGSVSHRLAVRASCPVLIVPPEG